MTKVRGIFGDSPLLAVKTGSPLSNAVPYFWIVYCAVTSVVPTSVAVKGPLTVTFSVLSVGRVTFSAEMVAVAFAALPSSTVAGMVTV